ncbi:hypothetical protein GJ496_010360 [Pomphorhynchus laevis]|nr:hypothetical protein GJ496_010360 [Pomphorhynchus laevis]
MFSLVRKIIGCTNCDSICKVHLYDFGIEQFIHISQLYRISDNLVEVLPSQDIKVIINRKSALPSLSDTIRSLLKRQFVFLKLVSHENMVEIACQINHPCRKMLYLSLLTKMQTKEITCKNVTVKFAKKHIKKAKRSQSDNRLQRKEKQIKTHAKPPESARRRPRAHEAVRKSTTQQLGLKTQQLVL